MAANDAIPATNAKGATDQNTVGTERKSKSPVNLFAFVFHPSRFSIPHFIGFFFAFGLGSAGIVALIKPTR